MSETMVSKSIILGSDKKFDLRSVPFSAKGSYMCVLEDPYDRSLYLSITRSPAMMMERKNLIKLAPVLDNKEISYKYYAEPGKLTITTFKGNIEICFANDRQIRVKGKGIGVRFSFNNMIRFENASPKENGDLEIAYIILGKLLFSPLRGSMSNNAVWTPGKAMVEDFMIEMIPPMDTGEYEIAIHEYYSNGWRDGQYAPFDDCVTANEADFSEFCKSYPDVPEKYEDMALAAKWTIWNHIVRPEGRLKTEIVYASRDSFVRAFSWHQSFQAMAACKNIRLAWNLILNMFEYQTEAGQIPNNIGDIGVDYMYVRPPVQGYALNFLLNNCDLSSLGKEDYSKLYEKLAKFAGWFYEMRDHAETGIPQYYHPGESGYNDSTLFREGAPLQSGDLLAHLVLLTEACSKLAGKAGLANDGEKWENESGRLLKILVEEFWDGRQFISRLAETGEKVRTECVATLQPIMLGSRLPEEIVDAVAKRLEDEDEFMTAGGIASEKLGSADFKIKGSFMRGGIVGVVQQFIALGLKDAGKDALAEKIASRYCDLLLEKGLGFSLWPYDTDPATGLPLREEDLYKTKDREEAPDLFKKEKKEIETVFPWSSWTAASFLTLASQIAKE